MTFIFNNNNNNNYLWRLVSKARIADLSGSETAAWFYIH